jgi:hypothetical protein
MNFMSVGLVLLSIGGKSFNEQMKIFVMSLADGLVSALHFHLPIKCSFSAESDSNHP